MHNGKYQCHMAASCTYQYHLATPAAQQEPYQKSLTWQKMLEEFPGKMENGPVTEKQEDRARELSRKTRREI